MSFIFRKRNAMYSKDVINVHKDLLKINATAVSRYMYVCTYDYVRVLQEKCKGERNMCGPAIKLCISFML